MMYNNKLVVAVKVNGKVLREFGDKVYIPFGAEYSLLIKNLSGVRAQVQIDIDGTSATDGENLIVYANQEVELQRFIKNGNLKQGNRFKFIERTSGIEEGPRGVKLSDGLIRVSYQFEKVFAQAQIIYDSYTLVPRRSFIKDYWDHHSPAWYSCTNDALQCSDTVSYSAAEPSLMAMASAAATKSSPLRSHSVAKGATEATLTTSGPGGTLSAPAALNAAAPVAMNAMFNAVQSRPAEPLNETGITVPGSKCDQRFQTVADFPVTDEKFSIVLHLLGQTEQNQQVTIPVTVKAKPKCSTCGHTNKAKAKFCSECGTSLEIV